LPKSVPPCLLEAMGEEAGGYSEEEYAELLSFLQDPKHEVQRFAAEGVLAQTETKEFLEYSQRHPRLAAKPLLRLVERAEAEAASSGSALDAAGDSAVGKKAQKLAAKDAAEAEAAGSAALQALVNLSGVPAVRDELVSLNGPRRCAEALRAGWLEGRSELAHWHAMLLANLTTSKAGQEGICKDEPLLRFLLAAYTAKPRPPPRDGYDDPLLFLGKVIGNVCALEAGRKCLAMGDGGPAALASLLGELSDRARRPDVLGCVRNVCIDSDCHPSVVQTDLMERMASFLYPWEKVEDENRKALPEAMQEALASNGAALTGDSVARNASAVSLLALCNTLAGREYLRTHGCPEVGRAWYAEESQEEVKQVLVALMPHVLNSEEEYQDRLAQQSSGVDAATGANAVAANNAENEADTEVDKSGAGENTGL